jgi:hypothetical protein
MTIFSRRSLQQMIDSNAQMLTEDQVKRHVDALNRVNEQSLDFEWEIAIIYGLSKLGTIRHEPDLGIPGKGKRLDIIFDSKRPAEVVFAGDVVAVSDRGLHKENPHHLFTAELMRRVQKSDLPPEYFSYWINGSYDGPYGDQKVRLSLPTRSKLSEFFGKRFLDFLSGVAKFPDQEHSFEEKTEQVDVQIKYAPHQQFFSGSHPIYTNMTSLTSNSLSNALKEKVKKFKESGYDGYKIVFVCDGGSQSLRMLVSQGYGRQGAMSVIDKFFRDHSSINLVVVVGIDRQDESTFIRGMGRPIFRLQSFENPQHKRQETKVINGFLEQLIDLIPPPDNDVVNAIHHLQSKEKRSGVSSKGSWKMTSKEVRFSLRAIQELLAGRLTQEEFFKIHGMIDFQGARTIVNPFERALADGRLIESTTVEKNSDKDDDWLVFRFGEPDPAIFRFRAPKKSEDER